MKTLLTLIQAVLLVSFLPAQEWQHRMVQFSSTQIYTDEVSTIIDYDNDGRDDILFGNHNLKELFLLRNNEAGILQLELITDTLYGVLWLHACEYNNDGMDDLIIAASTTQGDEFYLCVNQGNGDFEWIYMGYAPYEGLQSMYTDDYDGDGDMDVVYDDYANSNVIWLFINNGDNTFVQTYIEYIGQPTKLFGVTDMDLDGDNDFLTTYYNFGENAFMLVCEENIGNMEFIRHEGPALPGANYSVVGNFTDDNLPDFVVSSTFGSGAVVFYQNDGSCEFSESSVNMPVSLFSQIGVATDYDDDGDDDFFAYYNQELKVIIQNANNTFTAQSIITDSYYGIPTEFVDINYDGERDLVNRFSNIWHGNNGDFEQAYVRRNGYGQKIVPGQYSPDGNMDLVSPSVNGYLFLFNQLFDEKVDYAYDEIITGANIDFSTSFREVLSYDKDADGDDDLLCAIANYLFWFINDGDSFTQETVNSNVESSRLWIGDLDQDGNHDILCHTGNMKRWEWNGASYASSNMSSAIWPNFTVMDVDGDSDNDILYFGYDINTQETILSYMNNNNGVFSSVDILVLNDYFTSLQCNLGANPPLLPTDVDADGDIDLVIGSEYEDYVALCRNEGNAVFTPSILFEDVIDFRGMDVGDTDNDGDTDIVVGIGIDEDLMILSNDGNGTFAPVGIPFHASAPQSIHIVDMDNDGDNDIAYSSPVDYRIGWMENGLIDCERSYSSEVQTICANDSLEFAGNYISLYGLYSDTLVSSTGCDSVHVLMLDLFPLSAMALSLNGNTLTATSGYSAYEWRRNGDLLAGETSNVLDASDYGVGNYSVMATDANGCTSSIASVVVTTIISVNENSAESILVWPIPCRNEINISSAGAGIGEVKLLDTTGKLVFQISNPKSSAFDLSGVSSGMYQLVVLDTQGNRTVTKVKKE
ncbi:MAG: T9SS type A sorting domain-containing protein [Flavobacteriales bacterium]